jgi:hypothetical protein
MERHPAEDAFGAPSHRRRDLAVALSRGWGIFIAGKRLKTYPTWIQASSSAAVAAVPGLLAAVKAVNTGHLTQGGRVAIVGSAAAMIVAVAVEVVRGARRRRDA